ncbi:hypothetical protein BGW39_006633 [Mortierella sp. 14UC]|nr:hypothetical protein BGW39_006633 [Mortierella sp. 14UC]
MSATKMKSCDLQDFLVTVPGSSTPVAHICLTSDRDMDTLLAKESSRIVKCAQRYGPNRLTILLMVQPGHLSCLQALELYLLRTMSALDRTTAVPASRRFISRNTANTPTFTPISVWAKPNVVAFYSPQDTTDYLDKILAPPLSPLPRPIRSGQHYSQEQNSTTITTISGPTWLSAALSTTGTLLSVQDTNRLEQGLGTIQNAVLATPTQLQNTCFFNRPTSKVIHDFFNTDRPI